MGGLWLVALVVLVVAVAVLVRWQASPHPHGPGHPDESPLEILKRRFAGGEIDEAEFEEKRRRLS
jgi:putative membrane protein